MTEDCFVKLIRFMIKTQTNICVRKTGLDGSMPSLGGLGS